MDNTAAGFDWSSFEDALTEALVAAVETVRADNPGDHFYAAALGYPYCETDGVISLPLLGIDTVSARAERDDGGDGEALWNPADWEHVDDDWLPEAGGRRWEHALTAYACRGSRADWQAAYDRYLAALVRACVRSRSVLRQRQDSFIVVFIDDDGTEELVRATMTEDEVRRHFPSFDRRAAEVARVRRLPPAGQAAHYVARLGDPWAREDAASSLRALGPAAVPAVLPLLTVPGMAWRAAKILADIGHAHEAVISSLTQALVGREGPDQQWAACALSRLGHEQVVHARAGRLPDDVVAGAIAAPYTSFRDSAIRPLPLDYQPLADSLEQRLRYAAAVTERLGPGHGACEIRSSEIPEALRGMASRHVLIRSHAVRVLGDRDLGPDAATLILPRLTAVVREDPDADIRRLAILSIEDWSNDARSYASVIRDARGQDPDLGVRDAAAYCLQRAAARAAGTL